MPARPYRCFRRALTVATMTVFFAVLAHSEDAEASSIRVSPEVANRIYVTVGRIAAAGEIWRACILAAGTSNTQLRDIRSRQTVARGQSLSLREEFNNANVEMRRLVAVNPRTPDVQRQIAANQNRLGAINARQQNLASQLNGLDAEEKTFRAELEKQQSCINGAPAAVKSSVPAERPDQGRRSGLTPNGPCFVVVNQWIAVPGGSSASCHLTCCAYARNYPARSL